MSYRVEQLAENVSDRWVTIYALCEPIDRWKTGPVRYVGKTVGVVWHRVRAHSYAALRDRPRLPVHRWLRKHVLAGEPYHIKHLERVPLGEDWAAREKHWIAKLKGEGAQLLNITDGGEGLCGRRFAGTEHAEKISAAMKRGANFSCERCGELFWRKPRDIAAGNNRFCSRECYASSLKGVAKPVSEACRSRGIAAAAIARKSRTHCAHGHEFTSDNTRLNKRGARICKDCERVSKAAYLARRSAANA